jgi:hypothetical protein
MTLFDLGFYEAKLKALRICEIAIEAYENGAGSDHSEEARRIGKAQAEWCKSEIERIE